MNKYEQFTDDELYMLKRQALESSHEIVNSGRYSIEEQDTHDKIMNGILLEITRRGGV